MSLVCTHMYSNPTDMRCLRERHLRDLLETSQERCLLCDVFKTSRAFLKKDVYSVTFMRRLKNISRKNLWFFKNTPQKWFYVTEATLLKSQLRHGCSPVNLLHIFRTPFPKNTFGWLLLTCFRRVITISDKINAGP